MACQKGKPSNKSPKVGRFRCQKCKAIAKKHKGLCKPKLIKKVSC